MATRCSNPFEASALAPDGVRRQCDYFENVSRTLLLALLCAALLACGNRPHRVSGMPPQADIQSLTVNSQEVLLALSLRNLNHHMVDIAQLRFSMHLGDTALLEIDRTKPVTIYPRGRETVTLEHVATLAGLERLQQLADGEMASLQWRLTGELITTEGRTHPLDARGHLYRVPGRPGLFR